ncbi:hypothetical protein PANPA_00017 (plasmid) [Pantoea sp. Nvir]
MAPCFHSTSYGIAQFLITAMQALAELFRGHARTRVSTGDGHFSANLIFILCLGQFFVSQALQKCSFVRPSFRQYAGQAFSQFPKEVGVFVAPI